MVSPRLDAAQALVAYLRHRQDPFYDVLDMMFQAAVITRGLRDAGYEVSQASMFVYPREHGVNGDIFYFMVLDDQVMDSHGHVGLRACARAQIADFHEGMVFDSFPGEVQKDVIETYAKAGSDFKAQLLHQAAEATAFLKANALEHATAHCAHANKGMRRI